MENAVIERNVVVAVFNIESEGFQAFTELKQSLAGDTYFVNAAALVKKENGVCIALDMFDTGASTKNDTMTGGLIGMLMGVLGGPIGMLFGAAAGSYIGMSLDAADTVYGASMVEQIADKLDDGMVALVALAGEESNDALDAKLSAYDTVIARFDAEAVAEEVDRAYETQAEMARQARQELRKERRDEFKASVAQGIENFKSDMGITKASIEEIDADVEAAHQEKKEKRQQELEENSEILRQGFTK